MNRNTIFTFVDSSNNCLGCYVRAVYQRIFGRCLTVDLADHHIIHMLWNIEKFSEVIFFNSINCLGILWPSFLCLLYLLLQKFTYCRKYAFIKFCRAKEFNIFRKGETCVLGYGLLVLPCLFVFVVPWFALIVPWLLVLVMPSFWILPLVVTFVSTRSTWTVLVVPSTMRNFIYFCIMGTNLI